MRALLKLVAFVISFAVISSAASAAFAETQWERNHPRRDQVNDRLANQNRRINHELKKGEISRQQANRLHREDRAIRREERTWPDSTVATSPKASKRRLISRRTPTAAKSGAE